jgi:hypothetical protein
MKGIFTLLCSLVIIGSSFAQSARFYPAPAHAIFVNVADRHYNESFSLTRYEKDLRIARINEDYNRTLRTITNMRFVSAAEKVKLIHAIELKKAQQINALDARFFDERNKFIDLHYDQNFDWIR